MALQFLETNDLKGVIGANTLTQLRGNTDENLEKSEELAISELSPLYQNFDMVAELAKSGTERNDELIRMLIHITAYYLYNTVEDNDVPERIIDNYNNQVKAIAKISTGSLSTTLTALTDEDDYPKSNYRFGSDDERDLSIY